MLTVLLLNYFAGVPMTDKIKESILAHNDADNLTDKKKGHGMYAPGKQFKDLC